MRPAEPCPLTPYPPLIINLCIGGMIPTRDKTPYLAIEPAEIAAEAIECCDAGASIIHIHQRENGEPSWKKEIAGEIFSAIRRARPEVVISATTSGRVWTDFERRSEVLELTGDARPDMASLTLGNTSFGVNTIPMVTQLLEKMNALGVKPEFEVFDSGMIGLFRYFERKGLVTGRPYFNLLLGSLGDASAWIGDLAGLVDALPQDCVWAAAGLGLFQLPVNMAGVLAGGHVRVGIEDNMYYDIARQRLARNIELIERVKQVARMLERPLATAAQTREMLGLPAIQTSLQQAEKA